MLQLFPERQARTTAKTEQKEEGMKTTAQAVIQTIVEQRSVHDTHKYLSIIYD